MTGKEHYGHKTARDDSHEPLSKDEAAAIWKRVEERTAERASAMPTAKDALSTLIDARKRLEELGWWPGGGLRVKRGDACAVAETGSTGMWKGWYDTDEQFVHYVDCVSQPRNVFLKPIGDLTDDEKAWITECEVNMGGGLW